MFPIVICAGAPLAAPDYAGAMPNHVHLIVEIGGDNAIGEGAASGAPTLFIK